ncbi:hypothetical protein [Phreatobacter stygius]|uniref:PepSY domain-containing protein n=1 Tax=Phreatobacter stygius TaxID=1940610 RepID=A0A4D7B257_9HYPH|nr:hypothetical protein [Phreatobacter stygius]QCI66891.1 hypothetical protein E8M01_23170 [Phreatobacter stygius]
MARNLFPRPRRNIALSAPLAAVVSAVIAGGALAGSTPAVAQPASIETASETVIQGRILDRFGDRLLVDGPAGRILVDLQAVPAQAGALATGQAVRAEGVLSGKVLQARRIAAAEAGPAISGPPNAASLAPPVAMAPVLPLSETEMRLAAGMPLDAGAIGQTLEAAGFAIVGAPIRDGKDTEVAVRDGQGRRWIASLDRFGRLDEVELEDYDDDRVPRRPGFAGPELVQMVARLGFQARGPAEPHDDHFEILVLNGRSELIELHVDFAGQIYKQVWVR